MPFEAINAMSRDPEQLRQWRAAGLGLMLFLATLGLADAQENPAPAAVPTPAPMLTNSAPPTATTVTTNAPAATHVAATAVVTNKALASGAPPPKPEVKVSPTSYEAFRMVADRNIFNPNRTARTRSTGGEAPPPKPQPKIESFALVGTISYEKGAFAFFDSNSSIYRKTIKTGDALGDYKLKEIAPNEVKLEAEGKELALKVGMQMRREDNGPWQLAARTDSFASSGGSSSPSGSGDAVGLSPSSSSGSSGGASELLKRLMEQRKKEMNK